MTALCPGTRKRPTQVVALLKAICPQCGQVRATGIDGRLLRHEAAKAEAQ